jgi:general stress protein YciG
MTNANRIRNEKIAELYESGLTMRQIGQRFGLTFQRVQQIIKSINPEPKTHRQGFGSMALWRVREITSKGGKAAHEQGTAHEYTSEEAREAGHKGGTTTSQDREHMARIGRKGGQVSRRTKGATE